MPAHSHDHPHDHAHPHTHDHHTRADDQHAEALQCCSHHEVKIERYIVLCLVGGLLVLVSTIAKWFEVNDATITMIPAAIGSIILSIPLLVAAATEIRAMKLSSSTLAAIAILASLAIGDYIVAGWLAFILVVFGQMVRRSASGAQRAIAELVQLTPDVARVVESGTEREDVPLAQIKVGMLVRVRPGENLPVDGRIASGRSTINQASLTGEAVPVEAGKGDEVFAGTTNLTGGIDIEVTRVGGDTTIGRVTQLIRQAEQSRTPRQLLIEQVAAFFVPVVLSVAGITWFMMAQDPATQPKAAETAVSVLVVTCPSALLLASPSAMLAAFAAAARLGILIKQPSYLEAAATINTVVFDKTGTLTTGKFSVTRLTPASGVDGAHLLRAAALGEQSSNHPLAQSIVTTAKQARIDVDAPSAYEEIHGRGVKATTAVGEVHVGRASWLVDLSPAIKAEVDAVESKLDGITAVHVMQAGRYLGAVGLEDTIKRDTKGVIQRLRDLGVKQIAIFTGDRLSVAKRVGTAVGVDMIEAECLPEEKHEQIKGLVRSGHRTMMVGDGINDGPSLAEADVGVAMGLAGSDIAANSAGVALMNDDLSRVPFLMELARRSRTIIGQNIAAAIVISLVGLALAATGVLTATGFAVQIAALYHFVGDVFVLANSFRLFRFGEDFAQAEIETEPLVKRRAASIRGLSAQPANA
jgi:Zn2+/Cd2+-exporting ATPase